MAKDIQLMGAVFPDVPAIKLPQVGGGLVQFDDTTDATAAAEDIAKGKTAYVDGVKITGTASGGGGGSSNVVTGTFSVPIGEANKAVTINLPYKGDGDPVAVYIFPSAGGFNSVEGEWIANADRYTIICGAYVKRFIEGEYADPTYTGPSGTNIRKNQAIMYLYYINSSTNTETTFTETYSLYNNTDVRPEFSHVLKLKDKHTLSVYVHEPSVRSYGYQAGGEYTYVVVYSE